MDDLSEETPHVCNKTEALESKVSALKRRIKELESKLQEKDQEVLRLQQTVPVDPAPHSFSVGKYTKCVAALD